MDSLGEVSDRQSALDYLASRIDYERTAQLPYGSRGLKLDRMCQLLERLGQPHHRWPAVHIAGTKGKGSTAAMISAVLTQAGYKTGLYTSPHLESVEERLRIDGVPCTAEQLVQLVAQVRTVVHEMDRLGEESRPTYFEITTAMAMLHFAQQQVDLAVLEVGLGGRLDSTNVCRPLVSVITSISFDHMRQLGNTLPAIAAEKAGIIKPGVPVVSGVQRPEAQQVVREVAERNQCRLWSFGEQFRCAVMPVAPPAHSTQIPTPPPAKLPATRLDYFESDSAADYELRDLQLALLGQHQAQNAAVAVAALRRLQAAGWDVPERAIREGLLATRCPARIEVLRQDPSVVLDAAHNVASIEALVQVLDQHFPAAPRTLVFSTSKDKDAAGMLRLLLPRFQHVIFTKYRSNPRSWDPEQLASLADELARQPEGLPPGQVRRTVPEPRAAWQAALEDARPHETICIAGSFFLAAELRRVVLDSTSTSSVVLQHA